MTSKPKRIQRTQVKSFRAPNMELAMQQIHKVFGTDAQIIESKELVEKGRYPWSKSEGHVIVRARAAASPPRPEAKYATGSKLNLRSETREPGLTQVKRQPLSVTLQAEALAAMEAEDSLAEPPPAVDDAPTQETPQPEPEQAAEPQEQVEATEAEPEVDAEREQRIADRFEAYKQQLLANEVDEHTTAEILTGLLQQADQTQLDDDAAADGLLAAIVESQINIGNPVQLRTGERQVVACVGPAGSGKTTTLVKLASHFAIQEAANVAFITFDTFRIAAVEQLRTYADIIEAPIHVVTNLIDMRRAIAETQDCDFVFIDTGTVDLRDNLRIQELRQLLEEAQATRIMLCVSATSSQRSFQRCGEHFTTVGADSVIVTKTDEADGNGTILTAITASDLPVAYTTSGQNVPTDIEPVNGSQIAESIIGSNKPMSTTSDTGKDESAGNTQAEPDADVEPDAIAEPVAEVQAEIEVATT